MDLRKGSWYWDIRSDTTVWSEPLYGIVGRENAAVPPFREHFRFHTSESWIRLVDATLELLQNGTPYELRLQMLHADGTRKWVVRNGEAVRNERGDILELRGTVQGISERTAEVANAGRDWRTKSSAEDETSRLIQAQEEDNAKRASELRDNICQRVALLAAEIQGFSSTVPGLSAEAQAQLESLWQETTEILAELHRVSDRLYPVILELLGLSSAMRSLCRKFISEHGIPVEYSCSDVPANRLNKQGRLVLYRTLEEILASIASHSSANNVTVGLDHDSAELRLRVSDNEVGLEQANTNTVAGLGLTRIKAQIEQIGGSLAVWSQPGSGTLIEARTPLSVQSSPKPPEN
jgi:signal transduction histidine kinase